MSRPGFAYLFERFPSFVQAFCFREVLAMDAQGMDPLVFSIREAEQRSEADFPEGLMERVHFLPSAEALNSRVKALRKEDAIPQEVWELFKFWGEKGDKARLYEAHYIGTILREKKVRHVHCHFAGIAARTAFWMKRMFGISYSFTGHANDIFCEGDFPVALEELIRESRFVATVSDFSKGWLREKFPGYARKIFRVYNGIEVEKFAGPGPSDEPHIVSVGRLVEKKGFDDLIRACGVLRDRGVVFRCSIAGSGPQQDELRALIESLDLSKKVHLLGALSEKEVIPLLHQAKIFALACVTESDGGKDNLPTVIMEAMAASLPVVSTSVAGVPEMIVDGKTGWVTPERRPEAFADRLQTVLNEKDVAARMGLAGREMAARDFAVAVTARQLKRLMVRKGRGFATAGAVMSDPLLLVDVLAVLPQRLMGR